MARWAQPPMQREQIRLFSPNLDAMIPDDHPIRLFDDLLSACDWTPWENHYCRVHGQPAIHPRVVAGVILYGLSHGIRRSRMLEYMLASNIDFMWLAEGRTIDHSTICGFRTKFRRELKQLFKQLFTIAIKAGLANIETVALDATQVKANSSRHKTATAATITERMARLDQMIEHMLAEAEQADAEEPGLYGPIPTDKLPKDLADAKQRRERLTKALAAAKARDESPKAKAKARKGEKVKPAAVPIADPESKVLPNKEGGFAPNYTPTTTTESHGGFIADAEVLPGGEDPQQAVDTIDRIEEAFGQKPGQMLADSAYDSGQTLAGLDKRNVEAFIPFKQRGDTCDTDNPAVRDDPTQPVGESEWDKLPRGYRNGKLDRTAFVYDGAADCYYCPMGRKLEFCRIHNRAGSAGPVKSRYYQCAGGDCPLADQCTDSDSGRRSVAHDDCEHHRQAMDARLASNRGRKIYAQRKWIAETPFGIIKQRMGLRQFLLRGLEKVRAEWLWACTAFNLGKLVRNGAAVRAYIAPIKG